MRETLLNLKKVYKFGRKYKKALICQIKANIEMLFLVNEFYKQKNKTLTITFGKPIPWQTFDERYTDSQWAMKLRNFSYNLPGNCEQTFDPEKNYTI